MANVVTRFLANLSTKTLERLGATTKRAQRIRYRNQFDLADLAKIKESPLRPMFPMQWDIDGIRNARDAQLRGDFRIAARLADAMATDPGLFTSRLNRLAPMRGLPVVLEPPNQTARALRIAEEGEALFGRKGVALQRDHMVSLHRRYVDHGVSVGFNVWTPRADGSRVDVELRVWPQEYLRWREWEHRYYALTLNGGEVPVEHGDGRWVVFQQEKLSPWTEGAIVAGSMVWADRAFAMRDRNNASRAHGSPKLVAEMPEGVALEQEDDGGNLVPTAEAAQMLELLQMLFIGELPFGLRPAGSKVDLMVSQSQAWQIWTEIMKSSNADSDRIYLGQDGTTQNAGGNYIKSERLFGVRNDLVESDIMVFAESILTGTIEPWSAVNFGDSRLAPARCWQMPDADEDARRTSIGEHQELFFRHVDGLLEQGYSVDQPTIEQLARTYGVTAPQIAPQGLKPRNAQAASPLPTPGNVVPMSWRTVRPVSRAA
jgi:Protein of unknown function (DUF935)